MLSKAAKTLWWIWHTWCYGSIEKDLYFDADDQDRLFKEVQLNIEVDGFENVI